MSALAFDINAGVREANRRAKREERTPLVVYRRGKSYGLARLANIGEYLGLHGWPPDYSAARTVTDPADLHAIEEAERAIQAARRAADRVYARAFKRGETIDPGAADAAHREADR